MRQTKGVKKGGNNTNFTTLVCAPCRKLSIFKQRFPAVPIMALTATATPRVQADILSQLQISRAVTFKSSFNRGNLDYVVEKKGSGQASVVDAMVKRIMDNHWCPYNTIQPGIIYCLSRNDCEKVAREVLVRRPHN